MEPTCKSIFGSTERRFRVGRYSTRISIPTATRRLVLTLDVLRRNALRIDLTGPFYEALSVLKSDHYVHAWLSVGDDGDQRLKQVKNDPFGFCRDIVRLFGRGMISRVGLKCWHEDSRRHCMYIQALSVGQLSSASFRRPISTSTIVGQKTTYLLLFGLNYLGQHPCC